VKDLLQQEQSPSATIFRKERQEQDVPLSRQVDTKPGSENKPLGSKILTTSCILPLVALVTSAISLFATAVIIAITIANILTQE